MTSDTVNVPRMGDGRQARAQWIGHVAEWDGTLPVILIARVQDAAARRALLRGLVACVLSNDAAIVRHRDGFAPELVGRDRGLRLSSASRNGVAALAVAEGPVGVDVEAVDEAALVPAGVLHPGEVAMLSALPGPAARALAFARIWSAKEAYLKALGLGLSRDPTGFEIAIGRDGPQVVDPKVAGGAPSVWTRHLPGFVVTCVMTQPVSP